jgi:hypothetical protein
MNEIARKREYSPAAQYLLDAFYPPGRDDDTRAEFEQRGLVFTNNLGYHMLLYDENPKGSDVSAGLNILTPRTRELLSTVRTQRPDLWDQGLEARGSRVVLGSQLFKQMSEFGPDDPRVENTGMLLTEASWCEREFMSQIFDLVEPLTPEEAYALCG